MDRLSSAEIDLASIAADSSGDHSLEQVLVLSEILALPVTLLVGGVFVYGNLAPDRMWGNHLDSTYQDVLGDLEKKLVEEGGWSEDRAAELAVSLRDNTFTKTAERRYRRVQEHLERMMAVEQPEEDEDPQLADLPRDLARAEITHRAPTPVITLVNAGITPSGPGLTQDIGTMRVLTHHIAAWWLGRMSRRD